MGPVHNKIAVSVTAPGVSIGYDRNGLCPRDSGDACLFKSLPEWIILRFLVAQKFEIIGF